MEQQKIRYRDIMDLGFNEEIQSDKVYFDDFGYDYAIITKNLTKKIYLEWEKETQLCKIVRIDNKREQNIKKTKPIKDLKQLKEIIDFFEDDAKEETTFINMSGNWSWVKL